MRKFIYTLFVSVFLLGLVSCGEGESEKPIKLENFYKNGKINKEDGLKIDFKESWVHIRKSNTEMILRIYTEAKTEDKAKSLSKEIVEKIMKI